MFIENTLLLYTIQEVICVSCPNGMSYCYRHVSCLSYCCYASYYRLIRYCCVKSYYVNCYSIHYSCLKNYCVNCCSIHYCCVKSCCDCYRSIHCSCLKSCCVNLTLRKSCYAKNLTNQ